MSSSSSSYPFNGTEAERIAWNVAERARELAKAREVLAEHGTAEGKAAHIAAFENAIAAARKVVELASRIPPASASWKEHAKAADRLHRRMFQCRNIVDEVLYRASCLSEAEAKATACAECWAARREWWCEHRSPPPSDSAAAASGGDQA